MRVLGSIRNRSGVAWMTCPFTDWPFFSVTLTSAPGASRSEYCRHTSGGSGDCAWTCGAAMTSARTHAIDECSRMVILPGRLEIDARADAQRAVRVATRAQRHEPFRSHEHPPVEVGLAANRDKRPRDHRRVVFVDGGNGVAHAPDRQRRGVALG